MKFRPSMLLVCLPLLASVGWLNPMERACNVRLAVTSPMLASTGGPPAQDPRPKPTNLWRDDPGTLVDSYLARAKIHPIEVLLLGTFHFDDQGLDAYKPQHHFDSLQGNRQAEVGVVVDALIKFAPDLVCVERRLATQASLNDRYQGYRDGKGRNSANEITQIAFRLAHKMGHVGVHAIDALARPQQPQVDPLAWAKANGHLGRLATPLQRVQAGFLADRDRFIDRADLSTIFRFMNHAKVLATSHAGYLVGSFHAADGKEYPGPDGFVTSWHNRNLRIFANIRRVAKPGQRVVVLIGAGHVPILRHCVQSSPECRLVEVADVIPMTDGATKSK